MLPNLTHLSIGGPPKSNYSTLYSSRLKRDSLSPLSPSPPSSPLNRNLCCLFAAIALSVGAAVGSSLFYLLRRTNADVPVRREIRTLGSVELKELYHCLTTMRNMTVVDGTALYGPKFVNLHTIIGLHSMGVVSPTPGSKGHNLYAPDIPSGVFMTFHGVLLQMIEDTCRAILDNDQFALPYYNPIVENPPISNYVGTPDDNDFVQSAFYSNYTIVDYSAEDVFNNPYFTHTAKEFLYQQYKDRPCGFRNHNVSSCTNMVVRRNRYNQWRQVVYLSSANFPYVANHVPEYANESFADKIQYDTRLRDLLLSQKTLDDFMCLMHFGTFNPVDGGPCPSYASPTTTAARAQFQGAKCQTFRLHGAGHNYFGGATLLQPGEDGTMAEFSDWSKHAEVGDFTDLSTSPQDWLVWILWHNYMVTLFVQWAQSNEYDHHKIGWTNHLRQEPGNPHAGGVNTMPNGTQIYGFGIDDILSPDCPFKDEKGDSLTNRQVVKNVLKVAFS